MNCASQPKARQSVISTRFASASGQWQCRVQQFLINHKPFYFTGFGRHEDADLRGKGFDKRADGARPRINGMGLGELLPYSALPLR
ncbi:glycoside hydrolase family 2 TIM barrel-domain containing protein [Escherichia coli]